MSSLRWENRTDVNGNIIIAIVVVARYQIISLCVYVYCVNNADDELWVM